MSPSEVSPTAPRRAGALSTWLHGRGPLMLSMVLVGLSCSLPFLVPFKSPPVPSFHGELLAATLGLLAMVPLLFNTARLQLPRIALFPLGLLALLLVQLWLGRIAYQQTALLGALYLLWAIGFMVLGTLLRSELGLAAVARGLAWFILTGALLNTLVGWVQQLGGVSWLSTVTVPGSGGRAWANLAQPNQLADQLTLGLVSAALLFASGRLRLVYAVAVGLALCHVLSLTGSRAAWLYFPALITIAAFYLRRERSLENRRLLGFSVAALVAFIAFCYLPALFDWTEPAARLNAAVFSGEERPRIWWAAWRMFLDAPLLGVGFREFGWRHFVLNGELPPPLVLGFTDHAHNLPVHLLAEFGIVGLLVMLLSGVLWLRAWLSQPSSAENWWIGGVVAVLLIHSLLEYPLWYLFFVAVAAMVLGAGEGHRIKLHLGRGARLALAAMLLMGWLTLGQIFRDYLLLENFLAFRYRYLHATDEVNRRARDLLLEIRRASLLAPFVDLGLARTISVDPDRVADKLTVNSRAMRLFPIDDVVYRQAMLLALSDDQAGARRQWDLARASYPEQGEQALLVLSRRVEDGLEQLRPLLLHARTDKQ